MQLETSFSRGSCPVYSEILMMKSYQGIEILNVKFPENVSPTKKQYIHMFGFFFSVVSDSRVFFCCKKLALVTAFITPTFSIKGFFCCCKCSYCKKKVQEDLPENCDWVSQTQRIIQEWMVEIVSKFIFLYLREWLWTSLTRSEVESGI